MYKYSEQEVSWIQATDQGDHKRYRLLGYSSTPPSITQYLTVYRNGGALEKPTYSRDKKQYRMASSDYEFTSLNATITFKEEQSPLTYIYAEIPQPYLRSANQSNALCLDCHYDRRDTAVNHPGETQALDNHPVEVIYGRLFGTRTTLRNITAVKLSLEGGTVLCTTCHDPHNAKSGDGFILREDAKDLCVHCHDDGKVAVHKGRRHPRLENSSSAAPTHCGECHGAHKTSNLYLVRERVKTPSGAIRQARFGNLTGGDSLGTDTGSALCEVCHTQTNYHKSDGSGKGHNPRKNCLSCHRHEKGFQAGGGSSPCYDCHKTGGAALDIKGLMGLGTSILNGGRGSRHLIAFDNLSGSSCLTMCHVADHNAGSPNIKMQTEYELCVQCHNTTGGLTSRGKSIYVAENYALSYHNFTASVQDEFGLFRYTGNCTKCHTPHGDDSYPITRASINGRATGGNTEALCFGCHDGAIPRAPDIEALWNADPANPGHYDYDGGGRMDCVACHGPHGTKNSKMVSDSLGGPGLARDAICRACHSGTGGSVFNVMGSAPGSYGQDFSAASVHDFGLNVAIGGYSFDLTCQGCHDPHYTKNARLLQDKIVFSGLSVVNINRVSASVQPRGPVTEYTGGWNEYCLVCHASMSLTGGQSPYRRHPSGVRLADYSSDMHVYRTTNSVNVPLESGNVSCVSCHFTHGSPKPSLLRFENATTPLKRQCLRCHDKGTFLGGGAGSHGGFLKNEGNCSDCHNMHSKANRKLLQEDTESVLCLYCHNGSGLSKYNIWMAGTSVNANSMKGTGGTFGRYSSIRGGNSYSMHDINDEATPAPGGVTTLHRCGTCHNTHGSSNYRIMATTINNVTGIRVYARTDPEGNFINYSTGFVRLCAACHTAYKETTDTNGNWIRHPVGETLVNYTAEYRFFSENTAFKPKIELEAGNTISCVTCHYAHGSPAEANMKYPGGRSVNTCKTCHDRGFETGAPGSHAGYAGNSGTCSDCHSMHKEGNGKLLKSGAETEICVSCHDYPGTSANSNPSHLDVWRGNVFDAPSSWMGTGGSFGTYDQVNGGNAPSMHPVNSEARIAPGDSATVVRCGSCHDTHGSTGFRLIKGKINGKVGIIVTGVTDSRGKTVSYGGGMSGLCTACHKAYIEYGSVAGYKRHPVDVALKAAQMANYNHFGGAGKLPLETGNKVTCTTCHFAHGSPLPKMLRMTEPQLCQVCHAKGLDPADGWQDVAYTHGGFNGNSGNCAACHYIHRNVFDHVTGSLNRKLLVATEETELCRSCHDLGGSRRGSFPSAQVVWQGDAPASPTGWDGTGGSFGQFYNASTGGSIRTFHDINKTSSSAPGGTTTEHRCGTCHNPHGSSNYRILRTEVNNVTDIKVFAKFGPGGQFLNYSGGMSQFCTACHTSYGDTGTGVGGYRRHPVNLKLTAQGLSNLSGAPATEPKAQVESGRVMCLSCHFAHGSPSYAMLRMQSYTTSESQMCQQCHKKGYNASGEQVRYTHGGFNGNRSNCGMCHSTHAKNYKKLLIESTESKLCDNCHAGIDKFNAFKAEDPFVRIDSPSRFNVFSSVGNSFGNYSVGKGGVISWHNVDGTFPSPGGKTVELRCGKCHNPHGGDNFTMLRDTVEGVTGIQVFGHLSSTGPFNTYSSGFAKFCSACHTRLTNCGTGNPWTRHPVDFRLTDTEFSNWSSTDIRPRVPLEAGDQVTCITCHNSHGSKNFSLQRQRGNYMCQQCHKR